jgi:hypothetical protein
LRETGRNGAATSISIGWTGSGHAARAEFQVGYGDEIKVGLLMKPIAQAAIAIGATALTLALVWRQRRSDRWQAAGRCYQCGAALGFDSKSVTLLFKAPTPAKRVDLCGRCARHRKIWSYLVGTMIAVFFWLVSLAMRNGSFAS